MSHIDQHASGEFCWPELATTDPAAAKEFYAGLFGWTANDQPIGENKFYTMLTVDGRNTGALYEQMEQQRSMGIPPHWMLYVSVESADDTAAKAKELGGTVHAGPFDVFDAGRMAAIQDPQGAVFSIWQPKKHIGTEIAQVDGTLCWCELATKDAAAARGFYTKLFGWGTKVSDMGPIQYTEWMLGDKAAGGMMEMTTEFGDAPPHWMPYFQTADCEASASKVTTLGGKVEVAPRDIPNVGRFACFQDPQGAYFSVFQPG